MTVNSTANRASYTGNGVTTAFAFPYYFQMAADLVVLETVIATGIQTIRTLTADYTVTGTTDANGFFPNGGTINAVVAPSALVTWTIYRDPARTQLTQHVDGDSMPAASIDGPLDKLTMIVQRHDDILARALRQPDGDVANISTIPSKVTRANGGLGSIAGYDANGDATTLTTAGQGVQTSVAMAPVITAASLAAGRQALGVDYGTFMQSGGASAQITLKVGNGLGDDGSGNLSLKQLIDAQTVASYTVVTGDRAKLVTRTNASAMTDTITAPATLTAGWECDYQVLPTSAGGSTLTVSGGATIDGQTSLILQPGEGVKFYTDGSNIFTQRGLGRIGQIVNSETGAVATGTTQWIASGDVIPTNTAGDQYMSVTIAPMNPNSTLLIEVDTLFAHSVATANIAMGLFQDATSNAIATAGYVQAVSAGAPIQMRLRHKIVGGLVAGTPTTFKLRAGALLGTGGTLTFNGTAGTRLWGGTLAANITITEILP